MNYELIAQSESGASTTNMGNSLANVLAKFDLIYARKGWKIKIIDLTNGVTKKIIKSTYR